jgi:hypothetical protein
MPDEQIKTSGESNREQTAGENAKTKKTATIEIPYSPKDVISLKITIEFELKPADSTQQSSPRATEGGAHEPKEADRAYSRSTEGGAHEPKDADRTYTPPQ